jgi:coenzyme F420-reducing hydrogenase delta subunit
MDLEQLVLELLKNGQEDFNTILNKVANGLVEFGLDNMDLDVTHFYMNLADRVTEVNKEFSQKMQKLVQDA